MAYNEAFTFTTPVGMAYMAAPTSSLADGTNNYAKFYTPAGLAVDNGTNLFVADGHVIRRISPQGTNWVVTTLVGTPPVHGPTDGTNADAKFNAPQGIALDAAGRIYVADTGNNTIRKVTFVGGTNWVVTTIAGGAIPGSNDGMSTNAQFNHPYGIATDNGGNIFVADTANETIRKLTPAGTNWVVTTIAGLGGSGGSADGTNSAARFTAPSALVVDTGNIYVADFGNHTIRKITASGTNWIVSTIGGTAGVAGSANGTNNSALFNNPSGIAMDSAGHLFITDSGNGTVRKMRASGTNWITSTIAGLAGTFGNVNGTGSAARFDNPFGIAVDSAGTLYLTDQYTFTLRLGQVAVILQSTISANQVTFSWPLGANNFVLEMRSGVNSGPQWVPITTGISVSPDSYTFTTNTSLPSAFFRLHKP